MRDGGVWRAHHRAGELQFEICLKDVTEDLYSPQEAQPCCPLPETMSKGSNLMCLSKFPNKCYRLFMEVVPTPNDLSENIEKGEGNPRDDFKSKSRSKALNCLHLFECPFDSTSSSPSSDNPPTKFPPVTQISIPSSQLKLSWPASVGRWERRLTMSVV